MHIRIINIFLILLILTNTAYSQVTLNNVSLRGNIKVGNVASTTFDMTNVVNYYDYLYSTSKSGYLETNNFSRGVFTTNASSMSIVGFTNIYSLFSGYADIGVRVNGADYQALNFTGSGSQTFTVNLPGGTKTVEVVSGAQTSNNNPATIFGSWPTSITFIGELSPTVLAPPTQTKRIVFYGDSIMTGDDSTNPSLQAWSLLVRSAWSGTGSTMALSYGFRSLFDDCTDVSTCQTLANLLTGKFSGITNKYVYLQVSTNDYGLNKWAAATFGTNYARLLDDIHANDAAVLIYAQTAIPRATETANGSGSTTQDYRDQITTVCNARSSYCTVVDGTAIFTYPTNYADTVHPNLAGQTQYANYVKTLFSIP